jgi:uncharacterized protein
MTPLILATAMSLIIQAPSTAVKAPEVKSFPLNQVKLTGGPWLNSQEKTEKYLLTLEPERLLHNFRVNAGLEPKAPIYGGWENAGLAGHSLGHYLTACVQAYTASGDSKYKAKIDAVVAGLKECQAARPDGLIEAIPDGDKAWAEIKVGNIRSGGFDLNGMWSPWYTHHKVFMGLIDAYTVLGNKDALVAAEKFADWAIYITKDLTEEQWAKMLRCEYGGMNEAMAKLYDITGKEKYLTLAHKFYDKPNLDPLAQGVDKLAGTHSNTQIPKVIGLATLTETKNGGDYTKSVNFFWDTVVHHHSFVIGGNSDHEYFTLPDKMSDELTTNTCETCCTYNMLKLTNTLFTWDPKPEYLDYYERAHINHILASQNPESGMVTYFFPLLSGAARTYSNPEHDFTCCHGTGMENHTKHQEGVYFHSGTDTLYVAQFVPTELNWRETGLKLKQETSFPSDGKVTLTVLEGSKKSIALKLRHPGWAGAYDIQLNGKTIARSSQASSFETIERKWAKGDVVEFVLPLTVHSEPILGDQDKIAFLYGPTVLAADLGPVDGKDLLTPVVVPDGKAPADYIKKTGDLEFVIEKAGRPGILNLRPLYKIPTNRYAVYFDTFTQARWEKVEQEFRANEARIKDLESRTVDIMRIGEMQPERDHQLTSEKCDNREANGKGFRTPYPGGFFEFQMKVDSKAENELVVTFWVNSRGDRNGSILIDGQEIGKLDIVNTLPNNSFQEVVFAIPLSLTSGKESVKVRFNATATQTAASVSQVRGVRAKIK